MTGQEMHNFAQELWPINRSLSGEGVRETLIKIKSLIPDLVIKSVPSGKKVFDWNIPKEWHVNKAYIIDPKGKKICNYFENNLHLVSYSCPFKGELSLEDLKKKSIRNTISTRCNPYITSYYKERWGFCMTKNQFDNLEDGIYKVVVDTKLFKGELNYGELIIKGKNKKEIFLSTNICHPSLANNEISGIVVTTYLAKWLINLKEINYTFRIIFVPETIGSLTYLSSNYKEMKRNVFAGFNISCVGDNRTYSYLPSRKGNTVSDIIAKHVLKWIHSEFITYSWFDRGSDERQYCAPFIDLPIASIHRSKFKEYPEYHTSLDNLTNVVTPLGLQGGFNALKKAIELLERNFKYKVNFMGEPQLGKRVYSHQ